MIHIYGAIFIVHHHGIKLKFILRNPCSVGVTLRGSVNDTKTEMRMKKKVGRNPNNNEIIRELEGLVESLWYGGWHTYIYTQTT